jgi:hypothetical protein
MTSRLKNKVGGVIMSDPAPDFTPVAGIERQQQETRKFPELSPQNKFLKFQRNTLMKSLREGSLPCLPGESGYATTTMPKNIVNGSPYSGINVLWLQEFARRNEFPTLEFATFDQGVKANKYNNVFQKILPDGTRGSTVFISDVTGEDGEKKLDAEGRPMVNETRVYNVAQFTDRQGLRDYAEHARITSQLNRQEALQEKYGSDYVPPAPPKAPKKYSPLVCTSGEPTEYLTQFFTAVELNRAFKVDKITAQEFKERLPAEVVFKRDPEKPSEYSPEGTIHLSNLQQCCNKAHQAARERALAILERRADPALESPAPEVTRAKKREVALER